MPVALTGTAKAVARLNAAGSAFTVPVLRASVRAAMEPVYREAFRRMPVGPPSQRFRTYKGRLVTGGFAQTQLRVLTHKISDTAVEVKLGVRKEAFYEVLFQELGTRKMQAHPWLRPALQAAQAQAIEILGEQFRSRVQKVTG